MSFKNLISTAFNYFKISIALITPLFIVLLILYFVLKLKKPKDNEYHDYL